MGDLEARDRIITAIGCTDEHITSFCHGMLQEDASRREARQFNGEKLRPDGGPPVYWPRRLIADSPGHGARILSEAMRAGVASDFEKWTGVTLSGLADFVVGLLADFVVRHLRRSDCARAKRRRVNQREANAAAAAAAVTPAARVTPAAGGASFTPGGNTGVDWRHAPRAAVGPAVWHRFGAHIRTWHAPVVPASLVDRVCMRVLDAGNVLNRKWPAAPDPLRAALEYYNGPGPNSRPPFAVAFVTTVDMTYHRVHVGPLVDWGWAFVVGDAGADDDAFIEIARKYAVPVVTNDKLVDHIVQSANAGDDDEYATDVQLVAANRVRFTFEDGAFVPNDPQYAWEVAEAFRVEYSGEGGSAFGRWRIRRMDAARERREADGGQALARWRLLNPGQYPHQTVQRRLMKDLGCTELQLAAWVEAFALNPVNTQRPAAAVSAATGVTCPPGRSMLMRLIRSIAHKCDPEELTAIGNDFAAWGWPRALKAGTITPDAIVTSVLRPMLRARARDHADARKAAVHHRALPAEAELYSEEKEGKEEEEVEEGGEEEEEKEDLALYISYM
jgi:hypothetical protein